MPPSILVFITEESRTSAASTTSFVCKHVACAAGAMWRRSWYGELPTMTPRASLRQRGANSPENAGTDDHARGVGDLPASTSLWAAVSMMPIWIAQPLDERAADRHRALQSVDGALAGDLPGDGGQKPRVGKTAGVAGSSSTKMKPGSVGVLRISRWKQPGLNRAACCL